MVLLLRIVAGVVGGCMLAAAVNATVEKIGGYGSAFSFVVIAIAAGAAIASPIAGHYWSKRRAAAWVTIGFIAAGEMFGIWQTAERIVIGSEERQAPLREANKFYEAAQKRVSDAEAAIREAPTTSQRLQDAVAAKATADAAAQQKASERHCLTNCREILTAQSRDAGAVVDQARLEIASIRAAREAELQAARQALGAMTPPVSATPLADRTGIAAWKLDLGGAFLGSLAVNGLALFLIGFAFHAREQAAEPEVVPEQLPHRSFHLSPARSVPAIASSPDVSDIDDGEDVSADGVVVFLKERLRPAKGKRAAWSQIYQGFLQWHAAQVEAGEDPGALLDQTQFEVVMHYVCINVGIDIQKRGGFIYCVDRRLAV